MPKVSDDIYKTWTLDHFDKNIDKNDRESRNFSNSIVVREAARTRADTLRIERKWQKEAGAEQHVSSSAKKAKKETDKLEKISSQEATQRRLEFRKKLQQSHWETQAEIAAILEQERQVAEATALLEELLEPEPETDEQLAKRLQEQYDKETVAIGGRISRRFKSRKSRKSRKHQKKRTKRTKRTKRRSRKTKKSRKH